MSSNLTNLLVGPVTFMNIQPAVNLNRTTAAQQDGTAHDARLNADRLRQALAWFQDEVKERLSKSKGILPSHSRKLAEAYAEFERLCSLGGLTLELKNWKQFEAVLTRRVAELTAQAKVDESQAAERRWEALELSLRRR